jgi:hypothetical protein
MILDGKRNPNGLLANAQTGTAPFLSTNSVECGREYTMLEVSVLATGGTATVLLQKRGSQVMGASGPVRVGDPGAFVTVTDANNPAAGVSLTAGTGCTLRVAYPQGEFALGVTALSGATITAAYNLTGEQR